MLIENVDKLSVDSFQTRTMYEELLSIESELDRQVAATSLRNRAKQLGIAQEFDKAYQAALREFAKYQKMELANSNMFRGDCWTNFPLLDVEGEGQLKCGDWIADKDGVRLHTDKGLEIVCPHQIYISKILKNAETGKYKVELVFKVRGKIQKVCTDRETIATKNKILKLANDGVQVTSETAKDLVKYLADLESLNEDRVREYISTSKLGWIDGVDANGNKEKQFLPHMSDVIFDSELNFKSLFDSITIHGDVTAWYDCIRKIRAKRQPEVLINLAASFASVLVEPVGTLPFIVSLWGGTGIGKSVILKICASVWADPSEGKYISDPKATYTAMEARLNVLNNLPMMMDDMAQVKNQYDDGDFSQLIYRWCSGKGRERSNPELGLNKLTSWKNCTITNGERSMVDESTQGGAINRVIDIEASGDVLFNGRSGRTTVNVIENNYGFAGEDFIRTILAIGFPEVNRINSEFYEKIKTKAAELGVEKEEKQVVPMALILTADYLIEKYLFVDGVTIDMDQALGYLRNKGDVSEDKRAYEYLMNAIAENSYRFAGPDNIKSITDNDDDQVWGFVMKDEKHMAINGNRFDKIIKEGGFQPRSFLSWCKRVGIIECDKDGNPKKTVYRNKKSIRAVVIDMTYGSEVETAENEEFMDTLQQNLPFR